MSTWTLPSFPTLGTYLSEFRRMEDEPSTTSFRWPDSEVIPLINRARQQVMLDVLWPEASYYYDGGTVAGQSEYWMFEYNQILAIYIAGEPIPLTTIDRLEGRTLGVWDNSSSDNKPQWLSVPPGHNPSRNFAGWPRTLSIPFARGSNTVAYLRGGNIGIIPAPNASGAEFRIDFIPLPNTLLVNADVDIMPNTMTRAILLKTAEFKAHSEHNATDEAKNLILYGGTNGRGGEVGKILSWKRGQAKYLPQAPIFITARTRFKGPPRRGSGSGRVGS